MPVVDISDGLTIILVMIMILLLSNLVFLSEDSLIFRDGDDIKGVWLIDCYLPETVNASIHHKRAKISADHQHFFIHGSRHDKDWNHIGSDLSFYSARQKLLARETRTADRQISFDLTDIRHGALILVETDSRAENPQLSVLKDKRTIVPLKKGDWKRIVSYDLSSSGRYLAVHARNPYLNQLWDFIYFHDLKTGKNWQYLFPVCLSCKRTRITVRVDDHGQTTVEHKSEHRVFSKTGDFIDFYIGEGINKTPE